MLLWLAMSDDSSRYLRLITDVNELTKTVLDTKVTDDSKLAAEAEHIAVLLRQVQNEIAIRKSRPSENQYDLLHEVEGHLRRMTEAPAIKRARQRNLLNLKRCLGIDRVGDMCPPGWRPEKLNADCCEPLNDYWEWGTDENTIKNIIENAGGMDTLSLEDQRLVEEAQDFQGTSSEMLAKFDKFGVLGPAKDLIQQLMRAQDVKILRFRSKQQDETLQQTTKLLNQSIDFNKYVHLAMGLIYFALLGFCVFKNWSALVATATTLYTLSSWTALWTAFTSMSGMYLIWFFLVAFIPYMLKNVITRAAASKNPYVKYMIHLLSFISSGTILYSFARLLYKLYGVVSTGGDGCADILKGLLPGDLQESLVPVTPFQMASTNMTSDTNALSDIANDTFAGQPMTQEIAAMLGTYRVKNYVYRKTTDDSWVLTNIGKNVGPGLDFLLRGIMTVSSWVWGFLGLLLVGAKDTVTGVVQNMAAQGLGTAVWTAVGAGTAFFTGMKASRGYTIPYRTPYPRRRISHISHDPSTTTKGKHGKGRRKGRSKGKHGVVKGKTKPSRGGGGKRNNKKGRPRK